MATAINDFIQGMIMLVGIVAVIIAVLNGQGGFTQALFHLAEIPSEVPATLGQQGAYTSFFGPDPLNLFGCCYPDFFGYLGLPQMVHKFYAIKSENPLRPARLSRRSSPLYLWGCYFLGGFEGYLITLFYITRRGDVIYDSIIPFMLSSLSDILIGIVIVLVLSASMFTLSSLVLTSSSTLTLDFLKTISLKIK